MPFDPFDTGVLLPMFCWGRESCQFLPPFFFMLPSVAGRCLYGGAGVRLVVVVVEVVEVAIPNNCPEAPPTNWKLVVNHPAICYNVWFDMSFVWFLSV